MGQAGLRGSDNTQLKEFRAYYLLAATANML